MAECRSYSLPESLVCFLHDRSASHLVASASCLDDVVIEVCCGSPCAVGEVQRGGHVREPVRVLLVEERVRRLARGIAFVALDGRSPPRPDDRSDGAPHRGQERPTLRPTKRSVPVWQAQAWMASSCSPGRRPVDQASPRPRLATPFLVRRCRGYGLKKPRVDTIGRTACARPTCLDCTAGCFFPGGGSLLVCCFFTDNNPSFLRIMKPHNIA